MKKKLQQNLSFRLFASLSLTIAFSIAIWTIVVSTFEIIEQEKLADSWAQFYLEMEHHAQKLSREIETSKSINFVEFALNRKKNYAVDVQQGFLTTNEEIEIQRMARENWINFSLEHKNKLIKLGNRIYKIKLLKKTKAKESYRIDLFDINHWFRLQDANHAGGRVYVVNTLNQLVYSNSVFVLEKNLLERKLVQSFILNPLNQSLTEFETRNNKKMYGYFQVVGSSNLAIFAEFEESSILEPISNLKKNVLFISLVICFFFLLFIQWPIGVLTSPIKNLLEMCQAITEKNYVTNTHNLGFGELYKLSRAFNVMSLSLDHKEKELYKQMKELEVKARFEAELAIASRIQNNLLIADELPEQFPMSLSAIYKPADEVAGDWYGYRWNESEQELIVSLADVSGHGAGSSIFTGIIASSFDQYTSKLNGAFDGEGLLKSLNQRIFSLGKDQVHATMQILVINWKKEELTWYNCGHNFPLQYKAANQSLKTIVLGSSPLGMEDELVFAKKSDRFDKNDRFLLYSDGLIEATNNKKSMYSLKRLKNKFDAYKALPYPEQVTSSILQDRKKFCAGVKPADDTCLIAIQSKVV